MSDQSTDGTDRLKKTVYQVIDEIGPVGFQRVAEVTYEGDTHCGECERPLLDYKSHEEQVKSVVLELADRGEIYPDIDWNYRTSDTKTDQ